MSVDGLSWATWLPPEIYQDKVFTEKFLIENNLGRGGSGLVVGARHRELDQRVAIKFLWPGPLSTEAVTRFRGEARAASRIKNEHVVRISDVATTDAGIPFIVMEYLEGVDLERMLQQTPHRQLPVSDAIEFILQASEALAECHSLGIVHRDLKPSNLFCVHGADGFPMIKVLDFGISKLGLSISDSAVTDPYRILGSPSYMSPEQFDAPGDVDLRTDIWAIGVILYELVTGQSPFNEANVLKVWQKVRSDPPTPLEKLRPDAPAALTPVILKCLEKDRGRRYANLAELAKALSPFAPDRARASVVRILRTVESPGSNSSSSDFAALRGPQTSSVPTVQSLRLSVPRRGAGVSIFTLLSAACGLALFFFFSRHRTVDKLAGASVSSPASALSEQHPPPPRIPTPSPALEAPTSIAPNAAQASAPLASGRTERPRAHPSSPQRDARGPLPATSVPAALPSAIAPALPSPAPQAIAQPIPSATPPSPMIVDIVETRQRLP